MASVLIALTLYDYIQSTKVAKYKGLCKPFELPDEDAATLATTDVSIVLMVVNPPPALADTIRLWLDQNPKEFILVTIDQDEPTIHKMIAAAGLPSSKIHVITIGPVGNARRQQVAGTRLARGKVICFVDDDTQVTKPNALKYLLAPFENMDVGGVCGPQPPTILDKKNVTAFEAITSRNHWALDHIRDIRWGAERSTMCMIGSCMLVRASIIQTVEFQACFLNQYFMGVHISSSGNDNFITNWIQDHDMVVAHQSHQEAAVAIFPVRTSAMIQQLVRWMRTTYQTNLERILFKEGYRALHKKQPFLTRNMVERMGPWKTVLYDVAWIFTLLTQPYLALGIALWNLYSYWKGYEAFFQVYPECRKHVWALLAFDVVGKTMIEVWAFLTLREERFDKKKHIETTGNTQAEESKTTR